MVFMRAGLECATINKARRPVVPSSLVDSALKLLATMFNSLLRSLEKILNASTFGSAGVITAAVLVLGVMFLVPKKERGFARGPLLLLLLHLLLVAWQTNGTLRAAARRDVGLAALLFLLLSMARSGFLLFIRSFVSRRLARPLPRIFRDLLQFIVYAMAALFTLSKAGVAPGSLLTTSALLTAVVGLSLQDTLGNLFAGLAIQAQRPFDVGDWIQFDQIREHVGRVMEINWRATKVLTLDQVEVTIPNGVIAKAPISNFSKPTSASRRQIKIVATYDVAPNRVAETLMQALGDVPGILKEPPPTILVSEFNERGIEYNLRYYVRDFQSREQVDATVRERTWYAFKRAGLTLAQPKRTILTTDLGETQREQEEQALQHARTKAISQVEFLLKAPPELHERLAKQSETRLYDTGEVVLRQGEPGLEFFIVASGEVTVYFGQEGQNEQVEVTRLGSGNVFGEMSLLTGEERTATVKASKASELIVVSKQAFSQVINEFPEVATEVWQMLEARRSELQHLTQEAMQSTKAAQHEQRILLARIRDFFSL